MEIQHGKIRRARKILKHQHNSPAQKPDNLITSWNSAMNINAIRLLILISSPWT